MNGRVNLTDGLAADFHRSNVAYLQIPTCWSHRGGFEVQFYFLMGSNFTLDVAMFSFIMCHFLGKAQHSAAHVSV